MGGYRTLWIAGLLAIGAGALATTPAAAGRCGGAYPVDAPTTLLEVARQCNVRLADLREANPGVDPGDVRPGEYLAVPDEIASNAASDAAPVQTVGVVRVATAADARAPITDDSGLIDVGRLDNFRAYDGRAVHRIRVRDHRAWSSAPIWLTPDMQQGGRYSTTENLSFQRLSAMRIHNAGLPDATVRYASAPTPNAQLIECTVSEKSRAGEPERMRKIVSTPETTLTAIKALSAGDAFDCTVINSSDAVPLTPGVPAARFVGRSAPGGYRLPDYGKIGVTPVDATPRGPATFTLVGEIVDSYRGCLLLKTGNGGLWRLSARQPADDLMGKTVTVWGAPVVGGVCGDGPSMAVSHAIYAEPWTAD